MARSVGCLSMTSSPYFCAGDFRLEILLAVHPNQLEEIAERERSDQQAEQPEVAHAADRADQRDERMDGGETEIDEQPDEVVHAADHHPAPADQQDAGR